MTAAVAVAAAVVAAVVATVAATAGSSTAASSATIATSNSATSHRVSSNTATSNTDFLSAILQTEPPFAVAVSVTVARVWPTNQSRRKCPTTNNSNC